MDRRQAIKRASYLMGGTLSAPAILGVMKGCTPKKELNWQPGFLSEEQATVVSEVAERIIPATDTPGAKDVGVPEFIDLMMKDIFGEEDQQQFVAGITQLEEMSQSEYSDGFADLEPEQMDALLTKLEAEAQENKQEGVKPFFRTMKELTLLGFCTSEAGATQVLQHVPVPGRYEGCISVEEAGGRAWAV
ncbi:MAG: gluconate 2-dehydrogenase subunit 3 family protein [Bacteroidota bacterium]